MNSHTSSYSQFLGEFFCRVFVQCHKIISVISLHLKLAALSSEHCFLQLSRYLVAFRLCVGGKIITTNAFVVHYRIFQDELNIWCIFCAHTQTAKSFIFLVRLMHASQPKLFIDRHIVSVFVHFRKLTSLPQHFDFCSKAKRNTQEEAVESNYLKKIFNNHSHSICSIFIHICAANVNTRNKNRTPAEMFGTCYVQINFVSFVRSFAFRNSKCDVHLSTLTCLTHSASSPSLERHKHPFNHFASIHNADLKQLKVHIFRILCAILLEYLPRQMIFSVEHIYLAGAI